MSNKEESKSEERYFLYQVLLNNEKISKDVFLKNVLEKMMKIDDLIQLNK
jgi:hypothetical protein